MKTIAAVLGVLLGLCSLGMAQAAEEKKTLSQALDGGTRVVEGELVPAA